MRKHRHSLRAGHAATVGPLHQARRDDHRPVPDRQRHRRLRTLHTTHVQGTDVDATTTQLSQDRRHHPELGLRRRPRPSQQPDRHHLELAQRQRAQHGRRGQEQHQAQRRREQREHHHGEDEAHQQRRPEGHDPQHRHRDLHLDHLHRSALVRISRLCRGVIVRRPPRDLGERDQFVPSRRHQRSYPQPQSTPEPGPAPPWVHGPDPIPDHSDRKEPPRAHPHRR